MKVIEEAGKSSHRVRNSRSYHKAKRRAEEYVQDPVKLFRLLEQASKKAQDNTGPLSVIWKYILLFIRILHSCADGSYTKIPWQSLILLAASMLYFVMPIDVISEFIPVLGLMDDVALLSWTIHAIKTDIDEFVIWEKKEKTPR